MKKKTDVWTIYGEIEAMVAQEMGFKRIPFFDVPPSQRFNKFGQQARFACIIPREMLAKFEERVALLRA